MIEKIQNKLVTLIDGNWAHDQMGQLEELQAEVNKIGDLLTFTIAVLIQKRILDIDTFKTEYPEGWKIDYKK